MSTVGLAARLQEIPGVADATVDLTDSGGGINLRLDPGADEATVMERLRSLLVAYGVRSPGPPQINKEREPVDVAPRDHGIDVKITPIQSGARVEVATKNIKSFRVVAATPSAIAQGVSDAWCQVVGRVPVEVVSAKLSDDGVLSVTLSNGVDQTAGAANVSTGFEEALSHAVGIALDRLSALDSPKLAVNS